MHIGLKLWSSNYEDYACVAKKLFEDSIYDYIELYVVPDTRNCIALWKKLEIPYILHNAHFRHGFNLAKKEYACQNARIYGQTAEYADELNARYIIFHGGMDGDMAETAKQLGNFKDSRALIENKPLVGLPEMGGAECRGATALEIEKIIEEAGCGFCLDFGHAICAAAASGRDPYSFISELAALKPVMFHLSDVTDMNSPYDSHPHLGTGQLDLARIVRNYIPDGASVTLETVKDSSNNLDDFKKDAMLLRNLCHSRLPE